MAVTVKPATGGFAAEAPRKLLKGRLTFTGPVRSYDITADGKRFLMVQPRDGPPPPPVELVTVENWFEELKRGEVSLYAFRSVKTKIPPVTRPTNGPAITTGVR